MRAVRESGFLCDFRDGKIRIFQHSQDQVQPLFQPVIARSKSGLIFEQMQETRLRQVDMAAELRDGLLFHEMIIHIFQGCLDPRIEDILLLLRMLFL